MEFRLTYEGPLYAQNNRESPGRRKHKHDLRRYFHPQLKALWTKHPALLDLRGNELWPPYRREGFNWQPIVRGGLPSVFCRLDILMLRHGDPGGILTDIDNRLKTLFDALQVVERPSDLPEGPDGQPIGPRPNEDPFYVLLENDRLITGVSVVADTLLGPVMDPIDKTKVVPPENAVRLFITVTARPYRVHMDNLSLV
ncbi:MAG: hypothetical protein GEV13_28300 [Rhodospirillales bacterium]|nr:hypothetical protein [Rhodospirillales bacterium]